VYAINLGGLRLNTCISRPLRAEVAKPAEDDIDPGKNGRESRARNFSNTPLENLSVERDDLGNVSNGWLCEACIAR
jgi:hypothetical protein